jgi:hypothetical protein
VRLLDLPAVSAGSKHPGLLFPDCFFPQLLDLLQMVRTVFRHHPHVVCNRDPMVHVSERYAMSALLPGIEYWFCAAGMTS